MQFEKYKLRSRNKQKRSMLVTFLRPAIKYFHVNEGGGKWGGGGGKFLNKLWWCVGGEYYKIIWFYQLG